MKTIRHFPVLITALGAFVEADTLPLKLDRTLLPPTVTGAADGSGMESHTYQGYAVAADGNLAVVGAPMGFSGWMPAGSVKVFDTGTGQMLRFVPNPSPAMNDYFGAAVAVSGNLLAVGSPLDDHGATNSGIVYIFDLSASTPGSPVAEIHNPSPATGDQFGFSVAISGTKIIIGAPCDDSGGTDAGSVYQFDPGDPESLNSPTNLNHPSPSPGDGFGHSVSISGNRVVVGAPRGDAGAAFVYDLAAAEPGTVVATLANPEPAAGDNFGCSVAISGTRVVAGSNKDNAGATDAGRAYVFDLGGGPALTLANPSPAAGDEFGGAVAIEGGMVVVGCKLDDNGASNAGSAYVFALNETAPLTVIANPGPAADDQFGGAVAVSGGHALIGAWLDDLPGQSACGSVTAFDLTELPFAALKLDAVMPDPGENFGAAVAMAGSRLAVGIPKYSRDRGGEDIGIVRMYDMAVDVPSLPVLALENPDVNPMFQNNDHFGACIAISNGRVAVGSPGNRFEQEFFEIVGSVHVFDMTSGAVVFSLDNPGPGTEDDFGTAVAMDGNRLVVGARLDDTGAADAGRVEVYDLGGATPETPVVTFANPEAAAGDCFGSAVAISGNLVAVGAPYDENDGLGPDSGRVHVFDLTSSTPQTPVFTLFNENPEPGPPSARERFGNAVAIHGSILVVGDAAAYNLLEDPETGMEGEEAGLAFVYDLGGATPAVPILILESPEPFYQDHFGASVAVSGSRIVVGAPGDGYSMNEEMTDQAFAFVFDLASATPAVPVARLTNPVRATTWSNNSNYGHAVAISGDRVAVGAYGGDLLTTDQGAVFSYGVPEITVEAAGTVITSGSAHSMGAVPVGLPVGRVFAIRNTGSAGLALTSVVVSGGNAAEFAVDSPGAGELRPAREVDFNVGFIPSDAGMRDTELQIASDDADESDYHIALSGTGLSLAVDTDGDGMSDAAEYHLATLGFDWQTEDPARVLALTSHASDAGLFTEAEIQARHGGGPLIGRNPVTGRFTLTLNWLESADLTTFSDLPAAADEVTVNPEGAIEFEFAAPDAAAFFRIGIE